MSSEKTTYTPDSPGSGKKNQEVRYVPVEIIQVNDRDENQINLLDLVKTVWEGRRTLLIIIGFFTLFAVFNYLFGPREYESTSVLIQETQVAGGQSQQLLQRLSGINFGNISSDEVIPPNLYPQILYSLEFQRGLIFEEIYFSELGNLTLHEYFNDHYEPPLTEKVYGLIGDFTIRLPNTLYRGIIGITSWIKGLFIDQPIENEQSVVEEDVRFLALTRDEQRAIRELSERVNIEMTEGLITIQTKLPDSKAAAEVNHLVVEQIQEYVIDYRIEKARQNLDFVISQYDEAKERYEEAQGALANFSDQNINLSSAVARTRLEDLQNQRNLRFDIYNSLSQQVEQTRLKLQEETPVFNVLQRSSISNRAESSSKVLLIATIILGVVFGIVWLFTRNVFSFVSRHVKN